MITVREATEKDNQALIELQTKCPQGTNLILNVDSSPDYFARSKPFKDWTILVATDNNRIVGSAGYAVSDTLVESRQVKTAYEYGFMVDPQERRKGIAMKLQEHVEHNALERGVDLLHLTIIEDNVPSISLFSKMGFEKIKDCATLSLMAYKKHELSKENCIRSAEESDLKEIANMINKMYQGYNFFHSIKAEDLLDNTKRIPGFDLHNIFLFQDDQDIKACLGYWDYTRIRKYIVQRFNRRLRTQLSLLKLASLFAKMPRIPKPGEPLISYNLTTLAFKDSESLAELTKHVLNIAIENRINLLHVPIDLESQTAEVLSQFRHARVGLQFFVKNLSGKEFSSLSENNLYIDVTET